MCSLHPEPPSHLPPNSIPPDCHRALAFGVLLHMSDSDQVQILLGFGSVLSFLTEVGTENSV